MAHYSIEIFGGNVAKIGGYIYRAFESEGLSKRDLERHSIKVMKGGHDNYMKVSHEAIEMLNKLHEQNSKSE